MSALRSVSSFLFLLLISEALCSLYGSSSPVTVLTKKNFANEVFGSEHVWLVEFFAPWCGHCKALTPEYEKAASNLKGLVRIGAVNCDDEKEICGNFGVKGFPTIKLFPSKLVPVSGKKDAYHKIPEDYQGARTAAALANFGLSKLPSFVVPVTDVNHEKFTSQNLPKAILFTDKSKTSDLYKALAVDFHHRMVLGEAKNSEKKLLEQYGVETFPTLLVVGDEEGKHTKFEGKLGHAALFAFLGKFAAPIPKQEKPTSSGNGKESTQSPSETIEPATGEIVEIKDQATFDTKCVNKGGLCVLTLLDDVNMEENDIKGYLSVLKAVGEKHKGRLRVFYILNGLAQTNLSRTLDLSASYPNTVVLNPNKLRYIPYRGSFSEESLNEFFESVLLGGRKNVPMDHLPLIVSAQSGNDDIKKEPKVVADQDEIEEQEKLETETAQKDKEEL